MTYKTMQDLEGNRSWRYDYQTGEYKAKILMGAAAAIRVEIEAKLAQRVPAALTLKIKQAPELFATGIAEADAMLGGGVPRGAITEVSGPASTGKTSFGLSAIASITRLGNACAWVDVNDAMSPESAAAERGAASAFRVGDATTLL